VRVIISAMHQWQQGYGAGWNHADEQWQQPSHTIAWGKAALYKGAGAVPRERTDSVTAKGKAAGKWPPTAPAQGKMSQQLCPVLARPTATKAAMPPKSLQSTTSSLASAPSPQHATVAEEEVGAIAAASVADIFGSSQPPQEPPRKETQARPPTVKQVAKPAVAVKIEEKEDAIERAQKGARLQKQQHKLMEEAIQERSHSSIKFVSRLSHMSSTNNYFEYVKFRFRQLRMIL
jgi:hypothetical protein